MSVINDLVTDNRVKKTCFVLVDAGYDVRLIGRRLPGSPPLPDWPFQMKRMSMVFRKGPLFYLFFNLRLFLFLLVTRADLFYANDLDTLGPNFLVSTLKRVPLIYDSHELFCEVPELQQNTVKKKIWARLESAIVPKLKHCITVNGSIAAFFEKKYGTRFHVVRNISERIVPDHIKTRKELDLPEDKKIIILQGAGINIDRGAEELIKAMELVSDAELLIIGGGDVWPALKKLVETLSLKNKVRLIDKVSKPELIQYTRNADLGISIDKNTNLNYYYSLPNKIFDYIDAGLPIVASRLPEIEAIISKYKIGTFIDSHDPLHIAAMITSTLNSPELPEMRRNTVAANHDLSWSKEKETLIRVISAAGINV